MLKNWIEAIRLRTLPVSIAGVVTGIGFACYYNKFSLLPAVLCFVFALLAQITSNFANEYYDFKRGADKKGRAGFKRCVTEGDITPKAMRNATYITLLLACLVGCCLIPFGGPWIILVGILIAIFALAYSAGPYPLSRKGLGDVAVFLFFGIIPVTFTYYLQSGTFDFLVFMASISIGLLAQNVLLVNNYRDMEDDQESGKKTTVVLFGRTAASIVYLLNGYIAMLVLLPLWIGVGYQVIWMVPPSVYLILHTITWLRLKTNLGPALNPILGRTAQNMLIFAILLVVCLLVL